MKDNVDTTESSEKGTNGRSDRILLTVFFKIPLILVASILIVTAGAVLGGYLYLTQGLPTISELRNADPWTIVEARGNGEMYIPEIVRERIIPVELTNIPKHVVNAFLGAEDCGFFRHRALDDIDFFIIVTRFVWRGRAYGCGSTISDQVAWMYFLVRLSGHPRMWLRVRQAIMTHRLERAWSKKRILYVYLNGVYLGDQCYGVEAAAQHYFDKSVRDLTIAEAALIAGIVRNPYGCNPFRRKERARERRDWVLENMHQQGFITAGQFRNALQEEIELRKKSAKQSIAS